MARRELIVDDLDGSDGATTTKFSFADEDYEIDLAQPNYDKLRRALAPFVAKARNTTRKTSTGNGESVAIRTWALEAGLPVNPKGKIPKELVEQYHEAHANRAPDTASTGTDIATASA